MFSPASEPVMNATTANPVLRWYPSSLASMYAMSCAESLPAVSITWPSSAGGVNAWAGRQSRRRAPAAAKTARRRLHQPSPDVAVR
jgi:hypothetical protein